MQRALVRRLERRWAIFAVALLSLVVAAGSALPGLARFVGGPKAHVCHCETESGHAHCACPICFPELSSSEIDLGDASIKGRCGDDDAGFRSFADPAVLAPSLEVIFAFVEDRIDIHASYTQSRLAPPPEPPPPRA